jgi:hypothetical protein
VAPPGPSNLPPRPSPAQAAVVAVARTESAVVGLRCKPKSAPRPERPETLSARIRKPNRFSQMCLRSKWHSIRCPLLA